MRTALFVSAMVLGESILKAAGKYESLDEGTARAGACLLMAFIVADIVELFK